MSGARGGNAGPLIVAGAFAVVGVGGALWMVVPRLLPGDTRPKAVERPPTEAQTALARTELDTQTAGAPEPAIDAAVGRLGELLVEAPNVPGPDDLVAAFRERLAATVDPQYERDLRAKIARGMEPPPEPWPEGGSESWQWGADAYRGIGIGVADLEVRWLVRNGARVAPTAGDDGYSIGSGSTSQFDGVLGRVLPRANIIEVRLPMAIKPIHGEADGPVLVGYEFVWHPGRRQWVPHNNNLYKGGEGIYAALLL